MGNRRGSALAWTVIMMTVLTIIAFAILSTGYAYVARSTRNNAERQAYLTARSALEAVVAKLNGLSATVSGTQTADFTDETYDDFLLPPVGGTVNITGFSEFADTLGTVSVTLTREDASSIVLAADATRGDISETLYAHLSREQHVNTGNSPGFIGVSAVTLNMSSWNGVLTIYNGDLYVDDSSHGHNNSIQINGDGCTLYQTKKKNPQLHNGVYNLDSITVKVGSVQYTEDAPAVPSILFPSTIQYFGSNDGHIWHYNMYEFETPTTFEFNAWMLGLATYSCYVDDQRDYFIRVPSDTYLYMDASQTASSTGITELFIDVEENGVLEINYIDPNIHLYLFGQPGSTIVIDDNVSFTGAIFGDTVTLKGDAVITYAAPSGTAADGHSSSASTTYTWSLVRYAKEG
ncbi:MAG: TadE family protein [Clostridiaceae bacterium]|nr:TadE family protein [Clostridiaceae bacterium]